MNEAIQRLVVAGINPDDVGVHNAVYDGEVVTVIDFMGEGYSL